ncbi:MAG TPA: hypothetical protein VIO94_12805 [Phenylobacterium sp.]
MAQYLSAFSEPMTVRVVEGEVVVIGPDAVAVSLTPDAAEESAHRLLSAAREARGTAQESE